MIALPAWMFISWLIFDRQGWGLMLVLFLMLPSVFVASMVTWLLVRSRSIVQQSNEASWADVGIIGLWQACTIALGFSWGKPAFPWLMTGAILAFFGALWLSLSELWNESKAGWSWNTPPVSRQANTEPIILRESTIEDLLAEEGAADDPLILRETRDVSE